MSSDRQSLETEMGRNKILQSKFFNVQRNAEYYMYSPVGLSYYMYKASKHYELLLPNIR